jgi:hypothetical protein
VLPWIGRRISKHTTAYTWLPASTIAFPSPPELARRFAAQGFDEVSYRLFLGGVCALHVGTRAGGKHSPSPASHPERSEGAMPPGMPPSLRSG